VAGRFLKSWFFAVSGLLPDGVFAGFCAGKQGVDRALESSCRGAGKYFRFV